MDPAMTSLYRWEDGEMQEILRRLFGHKDTDEYMKAATLD